MDFLQTHQAADTDAVPPPIAFMAPVPEEAADKKHQPPAPPLKPSTLFWGQNPNILFVSPVFFPSRDMSYNEQLNAITRLIIAVTLFFSIVYRRFSFLIVGIATLAGIYVVHWNMQNKNREMFENPIQAALNEQGEIILKEDTDLYDTPTHENPFSNMLLTDIADNPLKKPAPPVDKYANRILQEAKRMVIQNNPTFPDIGEKLFKNLGDEYEFERSMQPFYSNAATTLPNDQQAFSDFCYGDMISCREGNVFACARSNIHYNNY